MTFKVFIDGAVGTTGLQIKSRLLARDDIELIQVAEADRKDMAARLEAYGVADVAVLCLPDVAAKEVAAATADMDVRLIDASTAHRVDADWAYGFPELSGGFRARIEAAKWVSNPGCYSSGAIALLYPLVQAGLIAGDTPVSINAVSGFSGGGTALMREYEAGGGAPFFVYGMGQTHKHMPEIMEYAGLSHRPVFSPSVGAFEQGMIVQVPVRGDLDAMRAALSAHYSSARFITVLDDFGDSGRIDPQRMNGSNGMELAVLGSDGCGVLYAVLDNLGKGASGAAVQNMNIMLGLPEDTGLLAEGT